MENKIISPNQLVFSPGNRVSHHFIIQNLIIEEHYQDDNCKLYGSFSKDFSIKPLTQFLVQVIAKRFTTRDQRKLL